MPVGRLSTLLMEARRQSKATTRDDDEGGRT